MTAPLFGGRVGTPLTAAALAGVHVALATPIDNAGEPDVEALDRLVARVIAGGADGICPTGSTGEGPRLTRAQRLTVLRTVRECAGPDRLIIPAPCGLSPADVIAEIDAMAVAGATAVLVAPPFYYPMAPSDQRTWYEAVVAEARLPLVLYNIPAMTGVSLDPGAVAGLAAHDAVIGIKDSSRDMEYLQRVVLATATADFAVLTGTDTLLVAALQVGASGAIAASLNLVPQLARTIFDAARSGDAATALVAQHKLAAIVSVCRVGMSPAGWKAALAWADVCSPATVPPFAPLDSDAYVTLASQLERLMPT